MNPDDRRRVVPVFFIVGGATFAYSSFRNDVELSAQLFGAGAGVLALVYGAFRLRQERRRPPDPPPGEERLPPPQP